MNKDSRIITQKQAEHKEAANLNETDVIVKDILNRLFDDSAYVVKGDSSVKSVLGFCNGNTVNVLYSPGHNFFIARLMCGRREDKDIMSIYHKVSLACSPYGMENTNICVAENIDYDKNVVTCCFYFRNKKK